MSKRPRKQPTKRGASKRMNILFAAAQRKLIKIRYKKSTTGEVKSYEVEPYSYRYRRLKAGMRKLLYAYDIKEKKIKGFAVRNIQAVEQLTKKYKPRWAVEIKMPTHLTHMV